MKAAYSTGAEQHSAPRAEASSEKFNKPLGERLIEMGFINKAQLELALNEKNRNGGFLGEVLVNQGFISQDVLTNHLALETNTLVIDVKKIVIDEDILRLIPYSLAKKLVALPISHEGSTLTVALADAYNVVAIDTLERHTRLRTQIVSASETDILEALERHYSQGISLDETIQNLLANSTAGIDAVIDNESSIPMLVDKILALGVKIHATDIHIEPDEKVLRIRMRLDGVLNQEALIPVLLQNAMIARIKLMADLDVTEKRVPQDGRIHFNFGRSKVDLRVSTLPTNHGESVVLRILEGADSRPTFNQLGLSKVDKKKVLSVIEQPFGMVLVTGPTGSGKTTTLYSALSQVDTLQRSVFTLEDPIEYSMPMVRQTQIQSDIGMTFAAGLRALLRQDPDVILVGEIRDQETAELATRAALTGHLVFSTLHTNDAVGVIPRLLDMGVERYLLPVALNTVIGQRLVRKICTHCKEELTRPEEYIEKIHSMDVHIDTIKLYKGAGCDRCRHSGYMGRLAIYEVLMLNETFHDPITHGASTSELETLAKKAGMHTMVQDGIKKAAMGLTTVEEVLRVAR